MMRSKASNDKTKRLTKEWNNTDFKKLETMVKQ